jgi:hypothetical protein
MIRRFAKPAFITWRGTACLAVVFSAVVAEAGITVDQYPPVHLRTGETMEVNLTDVRPALSRTGEANAACDMQVDFIDSEGVVAQSSVVTLQASKTITPCFLPADGLYRAVIAGPPERTANAACNKRDVRVSVQVENGAGETEYVIRAGGGLNHSQTMVHASEPTAILAGL